MRHKILDGGCLEIFTTGKSDVLLFKRGLGTITDNYIDLITLLAQDYEVAVTTVSKLKKNRAQPTSIEEYVNGDLEICSRNGIEPRFKFGHSLGGLLVLVEPIPSEKTISISPIVPVKYGLYGFLARALYQGAKGLTSEKGRQMAESITLKITRNLPNVVELVNDFQKRDYVFAPKQPSLVVETLYDEFFPATKESRKLFKHRNIAYKTVPRNHSWPIFQPEEVYEEVRKFLNTSK